MLNPNYLPYQVYLAWNQTHYRVYFSHQPALDLEVLKQVQGLENLAVLTPPLPMGLAHYVLLCISTREERAGQSLSAVPATRPYRDRPQGWAYLPWLWQMFLTWLRGTIDRVPQSSPPFEEPAVNTGFPDVDLLLWQRWQQAQRALKIFFRTANPEDNLEVSLEINPEADPEIDLASNVPAHAEVNARMPGPGGFRVRILRATGRTGGTEERLTEALETAAAGLPLDALLAGRALLPAELAAFFTENLARLSPLLSSWFRELGTKNFGEKQLPEKVQNYYQMQALRGNTRLLPAVGRNSAGRLVCYRCGQVEQTTPTACPLCGREDCACCTVCSPMGLARECMPFYVLPGAGASDPDRPRSEPPPSVELPFALTPAQAQASQAVQRFVEESRLRECLVWAVCGAGKTEVTFAALARALSEGKRVLYAIPRREVVRELIPRIEAAFPAYQVIGLYGGTPQRFSEADICVSTTHQALRFYQQFSLVVLDEVDAYPYASSPMLHYAVERARKPQGKIIYLTATPEEARQKQALAGQMELVYIPARHHGYPVPEPELIVDRQLRYPEGEVRWVLPGVVSELIYQTVAMAGAQLFIFVPSVALAERVAHTVNRLTQEDRFKAVEPWWVPAAGTGASVWAEFCHAKDPQRHEKREAFARGDFPVMVTTTILERGITIPQVHVLVLFADAEKIFDAGTLIQMAGRTGRTEIHPQGQAWFLAQHSTPAMRAAQGQIQRMNQVARTQGFLRKGT